MLTLRLTGAGLALPAAGHAARSRELRSHGTRAGQALPLPMAHLRWASSLNSAAA
jgi:hypothetical protein